MVRGLENRFSVRKYSDPEGKHDDCKYFVLDPVHDPAARAALDAYIDACENPELVADLILWLNEVEAWPQERELCCSISPESGMKCWLPKDHPVGEAHEGPHPLGYDGWTTSWAHSEEEIKDLQRSLGEEVSV